VLPNQSNAEIMTTGEDGSVKFFSLEAFGQTSNSGAVQSRKKTTSLPKKEDFSQLNNLTLMQTNLRAHPSEQDATMTAN